jgi:hypothetical protein
MKKLFIIKELAAISSLNAANAEIWTNWTAPGVVDPVNGSASGLMGGVAVTYSGENEMVNGYASHWSYNSTWEGGLVANAPPIYFLPKGGIADSGIRLYGGGTVTDTITFSKYVNDPVLAIASLGQAGVKASFVFTSSDFALFGGGPSTAWGGGPLTSSGNVVYGVEGNGLVQFYGSYKSISWTNPVFENYYVVTVGTVPEPATWAMMLLGFAGIGFVGYRKSRKPVPVAG